MSDVIEKSATPLNKVKWLAVIAIVIAGLYGFQAYSAEVPALYRVLGFLFALLLAAGIGFTTFEGKRFNQFRKDAWIELRRVIWPTRQETLQTTLIVVIFVIVVSLLLYFFDLLVGWLFKLIGIVG